MSLEVYPVSTGQPVGAVPLRTVSLMTTSATAPAQEAGHPKAAVAIPAALEAEHATIVRATLKRDADAAVAALSKHFMTTMHLVELATAKAAIGSDAA